MDEATLLSEYRAALPSLAQLSAPVPASTPLKAQLETVAALYPEVSQDAVQGINGAVLGIVTALKTIGDLPPTLYRSSTKEFLWGPFADEDNGYGFIAAYIRDAGQENDFRYHYAILRGMSQDVDTFTPIVWGGATPDPSNENHGFGITLWDFDANNAYEQANNSAYDPTTVDHGRFVAVYGTSPTEENPANEITIILAHLRNFQSKDNPQANPVTANYLYGRWVSSDTAVDFLDFEFPLDVLEEPEGPEDVSIRMAFIDGGIGRAEADASTGQETYSVTECWDENLDRTYLASNPQDPEYGTESDCVDPFHLTLDTLNVPSLDSLDQNLRNALEDIAQNGVPSED